MPARSVHKAKRDDTDLQIAKDLVWGDLVLLSLRQQVTTSMMMASTKRPTPTISKLLAVRCSIFSDFVVPLQSTTMLPHFQLDVAKATTARTVAKMRK